MDTRELTKALKFISEQIGSELQLQTLRTFMYIAQQGQCTQAELEQHLGMTNASTSRNVSFWTDLRYDKKPGKNMVQRVEDRGDRRQRILVLTSKGKEFFEKIKEL